MHPKQTNLRAAETFTFCIVVLAADTSWESKPHWETVFFHHPAGRDLDWDNAELLHPGVFSLFTKTFSLLNIGEQIKMQKLLWLRNYYMNKYWVVSTDVCSTFIIHLFYHNR